MLLITRLYTTILNCDYSMHSHSYSSLRRRSRHFFALETNVRYVLHLTLSLKTMIQVVFNYLYNLTAILNPAAVCEFIKENFFMTHHV